MKTYWITDSRFKIILLFFLLMWLGVMVLLYLKADEVTKNPCQICAKKLGEDVTCYYNKGFIQQSITFYPNFSTENAGTPVLPES